MSEERRAQALREALQWVDGAFVGDPQDVRHVACSRSAGDARARGRTSWARDGNCRADCGAVKSARSTVQCERL